MIDEIVAQCLAASEPQPPLDVTPEEDEAWKILSHTLDPKPESTE